MPREESTDVTYRKCYRRLRTDGCGRFTAAWVGWLLYRVADQDGLALPEVDREKWRAE